MEINVDELVRQGEFIAAGLINLTGFFLALLFFYLPPLRRWHEGLSEGWKPGVMAIGQALAALLLGVLSFTIYPIVEPSPRGILILFLGWVFSLATNQGTYQTLVRPFKEVGGP